MLRSCSFSYCLVKLMLSTVALVTDGWYQSTGTYAILWAPLQNVMCLNFLNVILKINLYLPTWFHHHSETTVYICFFQFFFFFFCHRCNALDLNLVLRFWDQPVLWVWISLISMMVRFDCFLLVVLFMFSFKMICQFQEEFPAQDFIFCPLIQETSI